MIQIFRQLDMFDLKLKVNTRTIKYGKFANNDYMGYSPVYTSVCKEMIRLSHDYWLSGVRYSNYDMKTVFVDLGGGLGKPAILAFETNKFDYVFSVDIDSDLVSECQKNFKKVSKRGNKLQALVANVEDSTLQILFNKINDLIGGGEYTLFVFNKNSYGPKVLKNSLKTLRKSGPKHQIYLYQNPIHAQVLLNEKFGIFAEDEFPSNKHKNYKYKLFWLQNYKR
jgi:SAM-dependent methyltransferase